MTLTILHSGGTRRDHCGAAGQWQLRAAGAAPGHGRARWGFFPTFLERHVWISPGKMGISDELSIKNRDLGMDQYLLIPFLGV